MPTFLLPDSQTIGSSDGPLVHNPAHSAEAVSHLIDHFRKPRWSALVTAITNETQEIEDVLAELLRAFDLEGAVGEQLDFLGKTVGERRDNRDDDNYRAAVRARMLVNASDGKPEQLYAVLLALLPLAAPYLQDFYPGSMVMAFAGDPGAVTLETIATLLRQARAAGVRLDLEHYDPAGSLMVSSADTVDLVTGWGSDTDSTLGGDCSSVV
jgi:hypothetical protein